MTQAAPDHSAHASPAERSALRRADADLAAYQARRGKVGEPPRAAPAPPASPASGKVVRTTQPEGHEGVKYSLGQVCRLMREGGTHEKVIRFARRAVNDAGAPKGNMDKARACFEAWRKTGSRWISDPVNCEFMAAAHHLLPDVDTGEEAYLIGCDCDEQVIALGSVLLGAGVEDVAVLGHSYDRVSRSIGHVLLAVHDGSDWVGVDPSYEGPFGTTMRPTWEILIAMPSMEVLCNGDSCTGRGGKASGKRGDLSKAPVSHVRLEGLPHDAHASRGALADDPVAASAATTPQPSPALAGAFGDDLRAWRLELRAQADAAAAAHAGWLRDASDLGVDPHQFFTLDQEAQLAQLLQAASFFDTVLWQVTTGDRAIAPRSGDPSDFAIQLLPSDTQRFSGDSLTLVSVLTQGPGVGALPAPSPFAVPLPFALRPAPLSVVGEPITASTVIVVALIALGTAVCFLSIGYAIYRACDAFVALGQQATDRARNAKFNECREGGSDPQTCLDLQKSLETTAQEQEKSKQEDAKARQAAAQATITLAELAGGALAAGGLVALGYYTGAIPAAGAFLRSWFSSRSKS